MQQTDLLAWLELRRHGGRRPGAGRKRARGGRVPHRRREAFRNGVLHVTARVSRGVGSLRRRRTVREIEACFRRGCERGDFRVVQYSIQRDHLHYVVEAADTSALGRGLHGLHVRVARAVNRVQRRRGRVFGERFHVHRLRTPWEVRIALRYVLSNALKHGLGRRPDAPEVDPASSGRWFEHWSIRIARAPDAPAVARPRAWLLTTGWRRHGPIDPRGIPGAA